MVATVSVRYDYGAGPTAQDIDNLGPPTLRFKLADLTTIDTNNKLVIPGAGLGPYYSFWKHVYLYCDVAPVTAINNVKLYSDGSNSFGTGIDLMVGLQFPTHNSGSTAGYQQATGGATSGDELVATHAGITSSASIFNYTSASPLSISISEAAAAGVIDHVGDTTNYVLLQMNVSNTASTGTTNTETWYFSYDES